MTKETHKRTFAKTISWRLLATLTTITIVFIITGKLGQAVVIGGIEMFVKLIVYYGHERLWNKIKWGLRIL
jgi:uncharacterized membrane protein